MKIRSSSELQDLLDKEFSWRLREVDQLRQAVRTSTGLARKTLIRAGVALLYAHWEGFVKASAEGFLRFVAAQGKSYRELNICFCLHGLGASVEMLGQSKKHHRRLEALRFIINNLDQKTGFSWKGRINTKANLNSDVFESITSAIGIDSSRYATRYNLIDEQLLKARNQIAHGEWVTFDGSTFDSLVDETLTLLRWVKTDIENAVVLESYLARASNMPLKQTGADAPAA